MVSKSNKFLQALIAGLLTTFGSFYLLGTTVAGPQVPTKLTGDLWVSGPVTLNGVAAKTGITVFNGGRIKTAPTGTATINLNRLGRIRLEPDSEIVLRFSEGIIGGELISGKAVVNASKGISVSIATPSGMVEAESKPTAAALQVTVTADHTCVGAASGEARITSGDKIERVSTGEEVTVSKGGQGTTRRLLGVVAIGGGGVASAFGALASQSASAAVSSITGASPSSSSQPGNNGEPTAAAQPATSPSVTPTPRPVTPIKPPPTVDVCGCKFNANTGQAIDPGQKVTICHVPANDPTKRETLIIACSALTGHFNLNATPRAGHLCDVCKGCDNYVPPATCPK